MRIISQDGTINLPFESCIIERSDTKIFTTCANVFDNSVKFLELGEYSTVENAKEVMRIIERSYNDYLINKIYKTLNPSDCTFKLPQD